MKYLSVCSGIEAASVAWHQLGWEPVGFAEIEKFPSQVLAHRFPGVPNYGDMTKFKEWNLEPGTIDLLVGGTPCQAFSVAGLRKGLGDPRGNLALTFVGMVDHLKPEWVVWENVPGVLSSNGGRDFGSFLGALGQLGYGWPTESLTLSTSEWPSGGVVCSLLDTLQAIHDVAPRYYLSQRACAGILRRAEKRGKKLPPILEQALQAVVSGTP